MWKNSSYRFSLDTISDLPLFLKGGDLVFLRWDLWAGKTTLAKHILNSIVPDATIKSPTYVYYHKYADNVYHFDLYRLSSYEEFVNIGGEEILDNPNNLCLIEWPDVLEGRYKPNLEIALEKIEWEDDMREAVIIEN